MNKNYWHNRLKNHNQALSLLSPLINPFKELFSLTHFTYFFVNNELETACLSSNPGWLEFYLYEKLYLNNPFLRHPKHISSGCYFTASIQDKEFKQTKNLSRKFDIGDSMMLLFKEETGVKGFSFGLKPDHKNLPTLVNELPLLKRFCCEFEKRGEKGLRLLSKEPADINVLFKETQVNQLNASLPFEERIQFIRKIGLDVPNLSNIEKKCLLLLLKGETALMIASTLHLSVRTIEAYIVNLKGKLNCMNKAELISKAQELYDLGLLLP